MPCLENIRARHFFATFQGDRTMNISTDFPTEGLRHFDLKILAAILTLFHELISWVDNDVITDAPQRAESVTEAEATIQRVHNAVKRIEKEINERTIAQSCQANRILDEAEEAFGARSLAKERATCGYWELPQTVADYLLWIEDEASRQEELDEDLVYVKALKGVTVEIRALGFEPSPPPWE
jgi:hypothetical protein